MHVTPASTNEITIAGPDSAIASPMITKIPVPMIAPIPRAVRSSAPTERLRRVPSAVSRSCSVGFVANGPGRAVVAPAPAYPGDSRLGNPALGIPYVSGNLRGPP
jgi:hypothetical protein